MDYEKAHLILIAATEDIEKGVDKFWKNSKVKGRKHHPDFGKCMNKNQFKAFLQVAPYLFCDKTHWSALKRDKPWGIFFLSLQNCSIKRQQLIRIMLIILDESMLG